MEIYKPIKDFEDYEISNEGNVKSNISNKILKPRLNKSGYYYIALYKNKKQYNKKAHRLVAEAFLSNPLDLPYVNHKDENKQNNRVWINDDGSVDYEKSNLEWCDAKYNSNYGTRTERQSAKMKNYPSMSKAVVAVKNGVVVMVFPSTQEAERNGFNHQHVSECCRGLRRTCGGYQWFFKEDWEQIQKENASPHKREDA